MEQVAVIMSTYREAPKYVEIAIESILNQTYRDFEFFIVIDDPENIEILNLVYQYQKRDRRIRVVENERNMGLPASLNKALKGSESKYVARMDADDYSYPNRFEEQIRYLEENELDIVGCLANKMDLSNCRITGGYTKHYTPKQIRRRLMYGSCMPHSSWLMKREVYSAVKYYREIPRCEDYDFLLRARKCGFRIGQCNSFLLDYRENPSGISMSGLLEQYLADRYLAFNYDRLENVTIGEIEKMISVRVTEEASQKYKRASDLFERARDLLKTAPFAAGIMLLKSAIVSKYFRKKMFDILRLKISDRIGEK